MKYHCPDSECPTQKDDSKTRRVIRKGSYWRRSDGQRVRRYLCKGCRKSFSSGIRNPCFRQKKRDVNFKLSRLQTSGVSQRRAALILRVNRKTVVRKIRFLAHQARLNHESYLKSLAPLSIERIQFDDLETSEHSKCKPLSVALAVEEKSRIILGFQVSQMPAKGLLARNAVKKYGYRPDERSQGWNRLFESLKPLVQPDACWSSDENPHYPRHLKAHHPKAEHRTFKGRRGCVVGQGELKSGGFDPLFSLNHTCAMLRANMNRLFRRTWCTTKNRQGLIDHLSLYVHYHNTVLVPSGTR